MESRGERRTAMLPMFAVTTAVCAWGLGNVWVKLADVEGLALAFYRLWLASAVLVAVLAVSGGRLRTGVLTRAAPAGVLFGVNVAMFFSALKLTSVANANLITALQPALVLVVAGPLFGESVGRREAAWTALSLAGVAIVVIGSAGTPEWSPLGDLLAAGALVTFTGYFLISKQARETLGTLEYITGVQLVAAIVVTPITLASGQDLAAGGTDWLWLAVFVMLPGAGGHLLINWAHRYVAVSVSSMLMLAVPVVAAASAWIILDEPLGPVQLVGGAITIASIVAIVRRPASDGRGRREALELVAVDV